MKMIEDTLRAILVDKNVPPKIMISVLDDLLDQWSKRAYGTKPVVRPWELFKSIENRYTQLVGPPVAGLPNTVRVARIMSLYYLVEYGYLDVPLSPQLLEHFSSLTQIAQKLKRNVTSSATGITWTCLFDELSESNLDDVESGLGLYHLMPKTPLVALTYTINTSELRIPTVLDAGLLPPFVSKTGPENDIPRAWDWARCRWGLSEMVHRSGVRVHNPEVRFLGTTSKKFLPSYDGFASFSIPYSAAIEAVVSKALRQVLAHRQLMPFLSGEKSILEITPNEFEHFVAHLYTRQGYVTSVTKASHDGGIDVIAFTDSNLKSGCLIQAKKTHGVVGIQVIRELVGAKFFAEDEYKHFILAVATTGRFSKPAIETTKQYPALFRLLDYDELQRQIRIIKEIGFVDIVQEAVSKSGEAQPQLSKGARC